MANSDKNIVISPNSGQSGLPSISFTGSGNSPVSINSLDDSLGTLSFRNSGLEQFFSLDTNYLGKGRQKVSIFKINDRNGQPLFSVNTHEQAVDMCLGDGQMRVHGHNYIVSACLTLTAASISAINTNNNGYMFYERPTGKYFITDPSVMEIRTDGNGGVRFWKDGIVLCSMSQDLISSGSTGYSWWEYNIEGQEGTSTSHKGRHLITNTDGQWDMAMSYTMLRVRAGDTVQVRWGGGDPTNIDRTDWSFHNFLFFGIPME